MNEEERVELVPCPFCGSGDIGRINGRRTFTVECQSCGARMIKSDEAAAIEQWNARASLQGVSTTDATEQIISAWAFAHNIDGAARNDLFARLRAAAAPASERVFDLLEGLTDAWRTVDPAKADAIGAGFARGTGGVDIEYLIERLGPPTAPVQDDEK